MNSKMKLILAGVLTIFMFIGVKFGPVNELYKLDVDLENMYDDLDSYVASVEAYNNTIDINDREQIYSLQEKINLGREKLNDVEAYIDAKNNPRIIKEEILPGWSERLDLLQQVILSKLIDEALNLKENNDNGKEEFIYNIPDNLPQQWREYLVNLLN